MDIEEMLVQMAFSVYCHTPAPIKCWSLAVEGWKLTVGLLFLGIAHFKF